MNENIKDKDIGRINSSVKSMEGTKEKMRGLVLREMEGELNSI